MFLEDRSINPGTPAKVADPFSLEALVGWLEKQPGDDAYDYNSFGNCLMDQYLISAGLCWMNDYRHFLDVPTRVVIAQRMPWTFGAALERARSLLKGRSVSDE